MRSLLIVTLALLGTCIPINAVGMPDASKMNVLFIDIEDCAASALGTFGNPICRTPNLDRLAASGVAFHSAYVQGMACNPSRTSFLTGLRPLTTRVTRNEHVMKDHLPAGTTTMPEILKKHGLYTADIGKLFHMTEYAPVPMASFDRIEMYDRPAGWNGPAPILTFAPPRRKNPDPAPKDKTSKEYREWKRRHSDRYGDSGLQPEEEPDYRKAQVACALLKEFAKEKKQFFLAVSQGRPHTPLVAPRKYIDMYDPAKIPAPAAPVSSLVKFPYMKRATGGNPDIFTQQQPTPQQAREAIAAYYACVTCVDDNVGMILDALEKTGLAQNTIVIFLGDHGFHLGDHGCWSKYSMLEQTRRAPLIVRVPGAPANGRPCREIVEFVDLLPTLCDLLKVQSPPANFEGISFAPLLAQPERPWKKAMFMVEDGRGGIGQCVRTRAWSYMEFEKGEITRALYDLQKDPWETINVADDPACASARADMAALLKAGWKAALPQLEAAR